MKPITSIDDPRYVKAMSHPIRVRALALLQERTAGPVQLAEWLNVPLGVMAYHVRTLARLGLVELVEETRVRGAIAHHYRARVIPRVTREAWAEASPIAKQAAVGATLDMIHEYASAAAAAGGFDHADTHVTRSTVRLDSEGRSELEQACQRLLDDVSRIKAAAAERLDADPDGFAAIDLSLVTLLFEAVPLAGADRSGGPSRAGARRGGARSRTV